MSTGIKGCAKTGGRSAGVPNKKTASRQQDLLDRIEMIELQMGLEIGTLHPVEGLARIAGERTTPLDIKVDCLKSMAPYCIPKLSTVTIKGSADEPLRVDSYIDMNRFFSDPSLLAAAQRVALAMEENVPEAKLIEANPESVSAVEDVDKVA